MPGFKECLASAVAQGAITRAEAADLARRFDDEFAQAALSLGDDAAAAAAKEALEAALRFEAAEARRRVILQDAARIRIKDYLHGFRNVRGRADAFEAAMNLIEHYGYAGTSSVAGRAKAIVSLAHGQMAEVLSTFRRKRLSGARMNRPLADDVLRVVLGQNVVDPATRAMGEAIAGVLETLRQRFNAAGGAIAKLEHYFPQAHDARALLEAGREAWKAFVAPRLAPERMRDPLTGGAMTAARLDQALDHVFDTVTTDGWAHASPTMRPQTRGALASQRADHRFLVFKDADAWLEYDRQFGHGDPLAALFLHVNGMARDIATMEVLGPNPGAMVEWLKQVVGAEGGKATAGKPSLFDLKGRSGKKAADAIATAQHRIDSVYQYVAGRRVVSQQVNSGFGDARNVMTSAMLGTAAITAAAADPVIDASARYLSGLAKGGAFTAILHTGRRFTREEAARSAILVDDFLHIMQDEARWAGTLGGHEWSRWLADRTLTWSGLSPITQARKHVFARDFEATLADHAGTAFDKLPERLRRTMQGYGLDRTDWDVMRAAPLHHPKPSAAGFLRPIDVAGLADTPALPQLQQLLRIDAADAAIAKEQAAAGARRVAEKYLEMILGQTERAVPSGTARARSYFTGAGPKGTVPGEAVESMLQFKSFALSFTMLALQALQHEIADAGGGLRGAARGARYAGGLAIGLTLAGALALQLKQLANGKDPQPVDDAKFWIQAMLTGGGLGLMGDFLLADYNRFGHSLGQQLSGPLVGGVDDGLTLTVGNLRSLAEGKPSHVARDTLMIAGRYVPIVSSIWPLRAAYRRVFLDQLQYLVDPEASRRFAEQEARLRRETGQEFFWPPGEIAPARGPDPGRALGR